MPRSDLYHRDASDRERSLLERELTATTKNQVPVVPVAEARFGEGLYEPAIMRNVVRVLFISRDETLLNPTQQTLDGFIALSDLFDEVHILILRQGIPPKYPVLRVAKNVWLYTVSARAWWWTPVVARRLVADQLVFVGGLRADLIVARDPFESGLLASWLARYYQRPAQLHVLQDYTLPEFLLAARGNRWRKLLPRFIIPRFLSVRTATLAIARRLEKKFLIEDLAALPRYTDYAALARLPAAIDLKTKYPTFSFVMLFVGRLGYESTCHRVIDAAREYLRNPRVGLIIIGEGPAKKEFQKRAALYGITPQVVFADQDVDVTSYLKTAHVLIVSDTDSEADDILLRGAAVGIPLIVTKNQFRDDMLVHEESAYIVQNEGVEFLRVAINTLLNDVGLRHRLALRAKDVILDRFMINPEDYRRAYRASIEKALFVSVPDTGQPAPPSP
jgi:glycosyltransferase involved in cell wall biosynthesis